VVLTLLFERRVVRPAMQKALQLESVAGLIESQ